MHFYFVGLDVHKQVIAYCVMNGAGEILLEGKVPATREALDEWLKRLPRPWCGAMEATMFSHWIFHYLQPHAAQLKMGHPARMKAITAGKKKTDRIDARTIATLLRCDLLPECYVMPVELFALRQQLRFRRMVVNQGTRFKNRTAGMLMEAGLEYEKRRLHGKKYFTALTEHNQWIHEKCRPLLQFSRQQIETMQRIDRQLLQMLERQPPLAQRLEALQQIPGVGLVTALSWALETGMPERFSSIGKAMSYSGLTSALKESAGHQRRGPLSKQRNAHLQSALIECAKLAPTHNEKLAQVRQKALDHGANANRATLAVARKLVAYLLAADRAFFASQDSVTAAPGVFSGMANLSK
jgi:transposase